MSNYRLASNREFFVRDLIRDYCTVYLSLAEQVQRYERDGNVSHSVLLTLVGEPSSKGVFWRLKDTAHFLFRSSEDDQSTDARIGRLVDWCIGYAFHECCKLREDAFQIQHYAARLLQISRVDGETRRLSAPLAHLTTETSESCERELRRIVSVLREGMRLLVQLLPSASANCSLARFLVTRQDRVRRAFLNLYPDLLRALYQDTPQRMYTLAAADFMDCGRKAEAGHWLALARQQGFLDEDGESMLRALESAGAGI